MVRARLPADDVGLRLEHPELSLAKRAALEREAAHAELHCAVDELRKGGLDAGLLAGLSDGGRLVFSQRITEGYACCRARLWVSEAMP
jgi:hypothetical protein